MKKMKEIEFKWNPKIPHCNHKWYLTRPRSKCPRFYAL